MIAVYAMLHGQAIERLSHAERGGQDGDAGVQGEAVCLRHARMGGRLEGLDLPALPQFQIDVPTQELLRAIAADTVHVWPPRMWCPSDPFS